MTGSRRWHGLALIGTILILGPAGCRHYELVAPTPGMDASDWPNTASVSPFAPRIEGLPGKRKERTNIELAQATMPPIVGGPHRSMTTRKPTARTVDTPVFADSASAKETGGEEFAAHRNASASRPAPLPPAKLPAALPMSTGECRECAKQIQCSDCVTCAACNVQPQGNIQRVSLRSLPKEGALVNTPPYIIETPDILLVEATTPDQAIGGQHLVRMDGSINLGVHGSVRVAGLTIAEARQAVQEHLGKYTSPPRVNLDVFAYNSKFYYVVTNGQVTRLNFTGNETVLDAISFLGGMPDLASKQIWIARPDPNNPKNSMMLPVDWVAVVQRGEAATNYQLFPGDRLFVADPPRQRKPVGLLGKLREQR